MTSTNSRQIGRWELEGVTGAVVVIDVLRAFTTAAYAFDAGAEAIYLVAEVEEALSFKSCTHGILAMGESHGLRPDGFDFSNSPAALHRADLTGRTLVQRTSAGTQAVISAANADRLWAASLVCASATAAALKSSGLGLPTYVISGCFADAPNTTGEDDRLTAALIERSRTAKPLAARATAAALRNTPEARRSLSLGPEHCDPMDIELAGHVDKFDFAMEVVRDERGLRLDATRPLRL